VSASYLTAALMTGIAAGIMFIVGVSFAVNRREHRADSEMRTAWEQEVAGTTMPPWDGLTWDWPETGLARYLDQTAELPDFEPVCTEPVPARSACSRRLRKPETPSATWWPAPTNSSR